MEVIQSPPLRRETGSRRCTTADEDEPPWETRYFFCCCYSWYTTFLPSYSPSSKPPPSSADNLTFCNIAGVVGRNASGPPRQPTMVVAATSTSFCRFLPYLATTSHLGRWLRVSFLAEKPTATIVRWWLPPLVAPCHRMGGCLCVIRFV
ncbi:unnamed protein product [Lactuca saligna]|uniref:Uncharacterized protein n=1 Tax=Lactuca saligna TaxID=75948 RepID=A0AA36EJP7_LACSI|nr:unnamed protein product [Lactuca saligna]